MTVDTFRASTQYSDKKGSAAADDADKLGPGEWLRQQGHMTEDEFLVGIELFVGENHGVHADPVYVTFLIVDSPGHERVVDHLAAIPAGEPVDVRRLVLEMKLVEFFALFKRFSVTLTPLKVMEGRQYRYADR
ncbi:hypothetical protein N5C55_18030 [Pseudomonas otitidis]|uniref:hypothetical protein n=1 Tax=Metapseudomonas otitidis TaxID=319939 RepID=UPI00244CDC07|nr:hypothetical protein [Pseudomonas otitidis]MDH1109040.1 hypothetical protein [Pseudomonas otitidis]MDH1160074.1 hypothetical protein [Pseudomonas otitidis]MDH1164455.1 hypothetical protein [Pseudomonas otitidis]